MKPNYSYLFWGYTLMIVGLFAFAQKLDYLNGLPTTAWIIIFTAMDSLYLGIYLADGKRAWGRLFPVCFLAGLSSSITIVAYSSAEAWIPTVLVGFMAIPFIAAFCQDHSRSWALISAMLIGYAAFLPILENTVKAAWLPAISIAAISLPFWTVLVFLRQNWWGVIPGGILSSTAALLALRSIFPDGISLALMLAGWALVFGLVWLRQSKSWAKYTAGLAGILAGFMLLISLGMQISWAIALIFIGLILIGFGLRSQLNPAVG